MSQTQKSKKRTEVFGAYYEDPKSAWGRSSGPGSNPYFTIDYRAFIEKFLRMNAIRSVVDIGCGDWQFSRFLNLTGINYKGFDVVASVIERNNLHHGSDSVSFSLMPEELTSIPPADLLLMKDVLQHLPNEEIEKFRRVVFGNYKHVLLTNSFEKVESSRNIDIAIGAFRCLDLSAPPYSFHGAYVLEFNSAVWERIRTFLYRES